MKNPTCMSDDDFEAAVELAAKIAIGPPTMTIPDLTEAVKDGFNLSLLDAMTVVDVVIGGLPPQLISLARRCKVIVKRARAEFGHDLMGSSVLDLVADQIPDVPLETLKQALAVVGLRPLEKLKRRQLVANINKVIIVGRVSKAPERLVDGGCVFTITSHTWMENDEPDPPAELLTLSAEIRTLNSSLADMIIEHLHRMRKVYVEGHLAEPRGSLVQIIARSIVFLDRKQEEPR